MTFDIASELSIGSIVAGFEVTKAEPLSEIDGTAFVLRHQKSGTLVLWLANDDENKAFSIAFKTPPADDTGVFHILEHSVLCGSRRYPVKEPFVNLLKTSMQTFLNAMTFSDKTMYPVASTNEQDLLNLMDVYMDAVLHPALYEKPTIFEQEGWHVELDDPMADLRYNGVVFNEMKGALSDPEDFALQELNRALFPRTAYGFESGGNPRQIVKLTYDDYVDTHRRHYNLSNAHIVLYGDISLTRELELLDERYLSIAADTQGSPNALDIQSPVKNMSATCTMDTPPENACVMVGYVIGTYADRQRVLACDILLDALMGSNEAPLKRTLLEADLGDDVDAFIYDGILQPYVVFELQGAREGVADEFVEVLESASRELVTGGVPRENLEAAIESLSFSLREREFGYADGVALAVSAMSSWLYDDDDPCSYLRFEKETQALLKGLDERLFDSLLDEMILKNDHMARVELLCAPDGEDSPAAQERRELAGIQSAMSEDDREQTVSHTQELHRLQAAPDTLEQLATLPMLSREDVGEAREEPDYYLLDGTPIPCLYHEVPTRKISYASHYFDLTGLTWDELPAATLLASLLGKLDTAAHAAEELDTLVESRLGRLNFSCTTHRDVQTDVATPRMVVGVSSIEENLSDLAALPAEIWGTTRFDDVERIHTILQQQRLGLEQGFASSGHTYAVGRALTYVSRAHLLAQRFGGIEYYKFVRSLLDNYDDAKETLPSLLESLRKRVFATDGMFSSFTGSKSDAARFWDEIGIADMCAGPVSRHPIAIPEPRILNEGFVIPSEVNYVAKADDGAHSQATYSGHWDVAARALSYGYLWDEVRVQGGAYGCGFRARPDGSLSYYTYRDPHIDESLARLDGSAAWLRTFSPDDREMSGYVVSTVASHDSPKKARIIAARQDVDYLTRRDRAWRGHIREQIVTTQPQDLHALADSLEQVSARGAICVFGSQSALESSKAGLEIVNLMA